MAAQYSIHDVYVAPFSATKENKFIREVLSSALSPNNQTDEGNFFGSLGMIGDMNGEYFQNDAPIQRAQKLTSDRGKVFRFFLGDFMQDEPRVQRKSKPRDGGQTLDRSFFEMQTAKMYAPALVIPDDDPDRHVTVPIWANYMQALRDWWGNFAEESLMIFALAGMRGQSENYEVYTNITKSGIADLQGTVADMTQVVRDFSDINAVYKPTTHFALSDSTYNPATQSNPNTFTVDDTLNLTDISVLNTYLEERNRMMNGFQINPGVITLPKEYKVGSKNSNYELSQSRAYCWFITPSVKYDMIKRTGEGTFAQLQTNLVQAIGRGTVTDNSLIGKLYNFNFISYRKIPRAYGGASNNVPICRTMILGAQAGVFATSNFTIPGRFQGRFHPQSRRMSPQSYPVRQWIASTAQGEESLLRTESIVGFSPLFWQKPTESGVPRRDRGRIIVDVATATMTGTDISAS